MDILYLLVPLSAVLILAILGVFAWALQAGQFDELAHEGERILHGDAPAAAPTVPRLHDSRAGPADTPLARRLDARHPNESAR